VSRPHARAAAAVATLGLTLSLAGSASAFCQLTTKQSRTSTCPEVCLEEGTPLAWTGRAEYAFNERLIPGMDEATLRQTFDTAFAEWTTTDCIDGPIDLEVRQSQQTTDVSIAYEKDGVSAILYRDSREWDALHPGERSVFALTLVAFETTSGRIVGADMELNGGIGQFTVCPSEQSCLVSGEVDLGNVVTHEAGHFVGMAHSDVPGSTMFCDAEPWETDKRTLAADDTDGICAAYPAKSVEGGCAAAAAPVPGAASLLPWAAMLGLLLRRRVGRY